MWKSIGVIIVIYLLAGLTVGAARAGEAEDKAVLEALLSGAPASAEQFTTRFLDAVPLTTLNSVLDDIYTTIGAPARISVQGEGYEVVTQTHRMQALITLDDAGQVAGLRFGPPQPLNARLSDLLEPLTQMAEQTSYLILKGDTVLAQKDAGDALAIGSAYKLAILRALQDDIASQSRRWSNVVYLSPDLRSLPSGILQDFPDGAPLTLHTLASLMISQSDNTAADILLATLGRDKVSAYLEDRFVLSTREFFQLKADPELAARFASADRQEKQGISDILGGRQLPSQNVGTVPFRAGVEWYLPANALCALIKSVSEMDVFTINPGVANPGQWSRIAFKGGSELGVLNLTTWVKSGSGQSYCVAFTANDTGAIKELEAISAYATLLGFLAGMK